MNWFYSKQKSFDPGQTISFEKEELHHIRNSFRYKAGDELMVTNGVGAKALGGVDAMRDGTLEVKVIRTDTEPKTHSYSMAIARLKHPDRMEWLVEKAQELRCSSFYIFEGDNSVARGKPNVERLERLALAAMKQSQHAYLMEIRHFHSLQEMLEQERHWLMLYKDSEDQGNLSDLTQGAEKDSCFLIGPEGDFSTRELHLAGERGILRLKAGDNRLRAETAALVACTTGYLHAL